MNATVFSLLSVTLAISLLFVWVYMPRNKAKLEAHAWLPVEQACEDSDEGVPL